MKHQNPVCLSLILSLAAVLGHSSTAAPLISVGDNTDIFFNGSSGLQWSSNVFRNNDNEEDDLMWSLTPGFEVNFGRGASNTDLSVVTQYEIRRYMDLNDLDTELFSIQANGSYQTSRLDLNASAYFREQKTATGDVNIDNDLVETDNLGASVNGEYDFSPKFSFGAGLGYSETEYKAPYDSRFSDRERFNVPLDLYYELTPKVDLSVGYTYGETDVSGRPATPASNPYTTEDHFLNVGARGNLLPKLNGFFKVGYRDRDSDRVNAASDSSLGLDSSLTWTATPKMSAILGLSRDFGVGGEGNSTENTSVSLTSNYTLNSYFTATAFTDFIMRDYTVTDREDDQFRLGARLTYTPNRYWSFGAGYAYSENDSDDPSRADSSARSYEDHTIDFTASLRY